VVRRKKAIKGHPASVLMRAVQRNPGRPFPIVRFFTHAALHRGCIGLPADPDRRRIRNFCKPSGTKHSIEMLNAKARNFPQRNPSAGFERRFQPDIIARTRHE
jgi:hypothetical protein